MKGAPVLAVAVVATMLWVAGIVPRSADEDPPSFTAVPGTATSPAGPAGSGSPPDALTSEIADPVLQPTTTERAPGAEGEIDDRGEGLDGADLECDGRPATIIGTDGDDLLTGTDADDVIVALGGDDVVYGGGGDDLVCGGEGDDSLFGEDGRDVLHGEDGDDDLNGGENGDQLSGDRDDDRLDGGPGDDRLDAGPGDDRLDGDRGEDTCTDTDGPAAVPAGSDCEDYATSR